MFVQFVLDWWECILPFGVFVALILAPDRPVATAATREDREGDGDG